MLQSIQGIAGSPCEVVRETVAAQHLQLSVAYLRKARREQRGPVYLRFGRAVRYRLADLDAWISSCAVQRDFPQADRG